MQYNLTILCVVYNTKVSESTTVNSYNENMSNLLLNNVETNLVIWDNSTNQDIKNINTAFCGLHNIALWATGNNESLSWVYNKVIKQVDSDFLCLFDNDTYVSASYLRAVDSIIILQNTTVAIPKIFSQQGSMYSPAKLGLVRGRHLKSIKEGFHQDITAITSGTLINIDRLQSSGIFFDENLNLYGVDTFFFWQLSKRKVPIFVLDVEMNHDLSVFNEEPVPIKLKREHNLRLSNEYIARKRGWFVWLLTSIYWRLNSFKRIFVRKKY